MAYRNDKDLEFLGEMKSKDLHDLVESVTKDKDGDSRLTEELTSKDIYKNNYPNHSKYWQLVAAEIQCFGANSFVTIKRDETMYGMVVYSVNEIHPRVETTVT